MNSKPILFSGPMVRAILEGRKTQTRRIVKGAENKTWQAGQCHIFDAVTYWNIGGRSFACPYGQPGDRLWVRETWNACDEVEGAGWYPYKTIPKNRPHSACVSYAADGHDGPWRSSIHMPRWASRITLEVTAVRVERLQDISEEDALAEGVASWKRGETYESAKSKYADLWESINGPGSWAANPWVWVVSFKRITP